MTQWQYKVTRVRCKGANNPNLDDLKESDLDRLGEQGWELVDVAVLNSGGGGKSFEAYFFFKRAGG